MEQYQLVIQQNSKKTKEAIEQCLHWNNMNQNNTEHIAKLISESTLRPFAMYRNEEK